ncbi:D-Ala-D-Ala carboxypeptidase family metallohydrolase [Ahrensia kielensis]|uniref:D-Ala-D-Ala carboxypeptidase family metallohydrolase n=1 Tax=Ahrensia kielensis TaxID=76980 RepID=UPI0005AAE5A0|nr:D-Ala-D-Ala carboxypeptidase family metallohydrolase [Ahrensia kielensis]
MRRIAKRNRYLTASVASLCGSIFLSGCVSSSINTSEGFAAAPQIPQTSDILALNEDDVLEASGSQEVADLADEMDEEEDDSDVALTALSETEVPSLATAQLPVASLAGQSAIVSDAPQAVIAEATSDINDVATQRIAAAASAPVGNSTSGINPAPADTSTTASIAGTSFSTITPSAPIATAALAPQVNTKPAKNRPGFLSALFGNAPKKPAVPVGGSQKIAAKSAPAPRRIIATASAAGTNSALPGVDRQRALGISNSSSSSNEPIQVASAAGLARLAPNGLQTQTSSVDVKCLKPALVRVLKQVERKYGKPAVVTSGYRSPSRNKRASGAKNSLHMYCAAADIQVEGVDKWALAKYLRSMPGRGGVGTYCHTKSVHIDIGPNRDWNWRCRRKK